ncbi:MAG: hypothetical protein AAFR28_06305 [Pseudomonadota bacterium]
MATLIAGGAAALAGSASSAGTIGTVLSAIATIGGVVSSVAGARNQAGVLEAQAASADAQASSVEAAGGREAALMRRRARLQQSKEQATFAQSGSLSGSAFGVLDQNAVYDELDALTTVYNASQSAQDLRHGASVTRAEAGQVRTGGYLSAAGKLASGVGGYIGKSPLSLNTRSRANALMGSTAVGRNGMLVGGV